MAKCDKTLQQVLLGRCDVTIAFGDIRALLRRLGFNERVSTKYEVIIYWSSEDHAFIAEAPELHG